MAEDPRSLFKQALKLEVTLETAREFVRNALTAKKPLNFKCPNCGKVNQVGITEDWEKRARVIALLADHAEGKPREAKQENAADGLAAEFEKMSDEELLKWLEQR